MSSSYRDDEEQLQIVKNWLREYGLITVISIVLAIAVVLGWQYWLRYQIGRSNKASTTYRNMVSLVFENKTKQVEKSANDLVAHYTSTPYAVLASLWLAQDKVGEKDYNAAVTQLEWALKHSKDKSLNSIITIRLAKIKLAQKKPDEALALLKPLEQGSYAGVAYAARGDIYYTQKKLAEAKASWLQALKVLPADNTSYTEVQYKLANLPVEVSGEKK